MLINKPLTVVDLKFWFIVTRPSVEFVPFELKSCDLVVLLFSAEVIKLFPSAIVKGNFRGSIRIELFLKIMLNGLTISLAHCRRHTLGVLPVLSAQVSPVPSHRSSIL